MGRITIFVSGTCGYCIRAKKALDERSIPYEEISIAAFPERRRDMISLSDQLTVPQIFFNDEHIGGADDLFEILKQWDNLPSSSKPTDDKLLTGAQEFYETSIASKPDPIDERLKPSASDDEEGGLSGEFNSSSSTSEGSSNNTNNNDPCAFGCFILPNGNMESLRVITANLMNIMPRQKLAYYGTYYVDCFSGKDGVTTLLNNYDGLKTRKDATKFGISLQKLGILHHVCNDHKFKDTSTLYFRLQPYHEPHVLNSYKKSVRCNVSLPPNLVKTTTTSSSSSSRVLTTAKPNNDTGEPSSSSEVVEVEVVAAAAEQQQQAPPLKQQGPLFDDALQLVNQLRTMLKRVQNRHMKSNGMDYEAALFDPEFELFEELACELQCVDVQKSIFGENSSSSDEFKFAFGINLYNLMIKHAFIKVGIPQNGRDRGAFYGGVCYNVGGHVLSLDDVEHGMLRANTRHPYQLNKPFPSKNDPRRNFAVSKMDPRIHFALNCGANSCPPISNYTVEALEEELRIAAMSFLDQDSNMIINPDKMEISLSMILKWYRADFCNPPSKKLPEVLLGLMRKDGIKREQLMKMIESGKTIKIKYLPYDWDTDATYFMTFKSSSLSNSQQSFKAFLAGKKNTVYTITRVPSKKNILQHPQPPVQAV